MINNCVFVGRLTYTPELKASQNGVPFIRFQIAVDRSYQRAGEERKADFIDCIAWNKTAEFINSYFDKGTMIGLNGSMQTDSYTDKDGNKRKSVVVNIANASFVCSKRDGRQKDHRSDIVNDEANQVDFEETEDDLPF